MTEPDRSDFGSLCCSFADLARKYTKLLRLRDGTSAFDAGELRALAREFPGALRELDALPIEELVRRRELAERAHGCATRPDPLLDWMRSYHATMRLALGLRARLGAERAPCPRVVDELLAAAAASLESARCAADFVDADFVQAVARPPRGRLNALVFARLADRFGAAPSAIEARLFRSGAA